MAGWDRTQKAGTYKWPYPGKDKSPSPPGGWRSTEQGEGECRFGVQKITRETRLSKDCCVILGELPAIPSCKAEAADVLELLPTKVFLVPVTHPARSPGGLSSLLLPVSLTSKRRLDRASGGGRDTVGSPGLPSLHPPPFSLKRFKGSPCCLCVHIPLPCASHGAST